MGEPICGGVKREMVVGARAPYDDLASETGFSKAAGERAWKFATPWCDWGQARSGREMERKMFACIDYKLGRNEWEIRKNMDGGDGERAQRDSEATTGGASRHASGRESVETGYEAFSSASEASRRASESSPCNASPSGTSSGYRSHDCGCVGTASRSLARVAASFSHGIGESDPPRQTHGPRGPQADVEDGLATGGGRGRKSAVDDGVLCWQGCGLDRGRETLIDETLIDETASLLCQAGPVLRGHRFHQLLPWQHVDVEDLADALWRRVTPVEF